MQIRAVLRRLGPAARALGLTALATTAACSDGDGLRATASFEGPEVVVLAFSEAIERPQEVPVDAFRLSIGVGARDIRVYEYDGQGNESLSDETYDYTYYSAVQTPGFAACLEQCYEGYEDDCQSCYVLDREITVAEIRVADGGQTLELVLSDAVDTACSDLREAQEYLERYQEAYEGDAHIQMGLFLHFSTASAPITFGNGQAFDERGQTWVEQREGSEIDYAARYGEFFPEFADPRPIPCP